MRNGTLPLCSLNMHNCSVSSETLALCMKFPLVPYIVSANSEGCGKTA